MSNQSGSPHLQVLFETALQDYEKQTGRHSTGQASTRRETPDCDSVESLNAVLCEQTQAFGEFRGKDKVLKHLKNAVSALYKLSAATDFGRSIGLVRP